MYCIHIITLCANDWSRMLTDCALAQQVETQLTSMTGENGWAKPADGSDHDAIFLGGEIPCLALHSAFYGTCNS